MALPPGATMAVTGVYANTPCGTCKAGFSVFAIRLYGNDSSLLKAHPLQTLGRWVCLTCKGARPSMGATEAE
jgi:hypothetical protein